MKTQDRITTADYLNLSCALGLNDNQRFLFLALPMLADVNGTLEYNPQLILNCCNDNRPADLAQLFQVMEKERLIELFEHNGQQYIYLTTFLTSQRLRTIAKLPSHPSVKFLPESIDKYDSKGRYYDARTPPNDLLNKLNSIDKKPTLEEKRKEEKEKKEGKHFSIVQKKSKEELKNLDLFDLYDELGLSQSDKDEGLNVQYDPRDLNAGINITSNNYRYRIYSAYKAY